MEKKCKIIIAPGSGFCGGVEYAVKKALDIAKNKKNGHVFLDGELVHNRGVNELLLAKRIRLLQKNSEIKKEDTILIRAHGISPKRKLFLEHFGCEIEDCTCPLVRKIAKIIEANQDKSIILLGDRNHAETEGLCGYAKNIHVCENMEEFSKLVNEIRESIQMGKNFFDEKYENPERINDWIIICQSTLDTNFLSAAKNLSHERNFSAMIFDTICLATKQRQSGLKTLENCDAVIVIGGFHSANTKRLFEKIRKQISSVVWIERIEDLPVINWNTCQKIGITAGASTPRSMIKNIYNEISKKIA